MTRPALDRRALLLGGAALLLAACGQETNPASEPARTAPASPPSPSRPAAAALQLPTATPWEPSQGEVQPEAKVAATRVVEALGTAPDDAASPAERLSAVGADPRLAESAGTLVPPSSPAVTRIVYPQYGGLTADEASVMVVADQFWAGSTPSQRERRSVTADVRLERSDRGWTVVDVRPVPHEEAPAESSDDAVAELLSSSRVIVPEAAAADLSAGIVDPVVARILLELADDFRMDVSVFRSGHPDEVFGTPRTSNHTRGRAVDVWAIDGRQIVDMPLDDPLLLEFLTAVEDLGSDEVGGPVLPPRGGGAHFANALHRDHVHIGFEV